MQVINREILNMALLRPVVPRNGNYLENHNCFAFKAVTEVLVALGYAGSKAKRIAGSVKGSVNERLAQIKRYGYLENHNV